MNGKATGRASTDVRLAALAEQAVGICRELVELAAIENALPQHYAVLEARLARGELVGLMSLELSASGHGRLRLELVDPATRQFVGVVTDRPLNFAVKAIAPTGSE